MSLTKPKGYWEKRAKLGRPKALKDEKHLWKLACDYFKWVDESPVKTREILKSGERAGEIVEMEVARPYTWFGFEDYLWAMGIISDLDDYRKNKDGRYSDYRPVLARIGRVMKDQKFAGASVGTFKERIIMADIYHEANKRADDDSSEDETQITINIKK